MDCLNKENHQLNIDVTLSEKFLYSKGVLPGAGEDPPTIVITAHYDSFGLAPVSHTY